MTNDITYKIEVDMSPTGKSWTQKTPNWVVLQSASTQLGNECDILSLSYQPKFTIGQRHLRVKTKQLTGVASKQDFAQYWES